MKAPKLKIGYFSLLANEYNTGIVLNKDFKRFNNKVDNDEAYWIFQKKSLALDFIEEKIKFNIDLEFSIYSSNGYFISIYNQNSDF